MHARALLSSFLTALSLLVPLSCHTQGARTPQPQDKDWKDAWQDYVKTFHEVPLSPAQSLPPVNVPSQPPPPVTVCDWRPMRAAPPLVSNPTADIAPLASQSTSAHYFTVANTGTFPVTITKVTLYECLGLGWTPIDAVAVFQRWIMLVGETCQGKTLAPGDSCTMQVSFTTHIVKAKLEIEDASGVLLEIPLAATP